MQTDRCISFFLKEGIIKGHFCRLSNSITKALENHEYPLQINSLLAEMAAISQCFTMDIKSKSRATIQIMGTSPVKLALVNSTDSKSFRCCATLNNNLLKSENNLSLPMLFGANGKLIFTVDFENQHYQTIVELNAHTLQECFQYYFTQSQQVQSIVLVSSKTQNNKTESAALLLQKTPPACEQDCELENELWHATSCFAATIKSHEILSSGPSMEKLIELVFADLSPTVSRETFLDFQCTCNKDKLLNILKNLEPHSDDQQNLEICCEYCGKKYLIDSTEIFK